MAEELTHDEKVFVFGGVINQRAIKADGRAERARGCLGGMSQMGKRHVSVESPSPG